MNKKQILLSTAVLLAIAGVIILWLSGNKNTGAEYPEEIAGHVSTPLLYGLDTTGFEIAEGIIANGETLGALFARYGVGVAMTDRTARVADSVFSLKNIRAGNKYTVFLEPDTLPRLRHFVYEHNRTDFVVISFDGDDVEVRKEVKDINIRRRTASGVIESSLWNSMVQAGISPALSMDLSDVYAWSIDFFGLQRGDSYTVIYDEMYVDSTNIGAGRIWGAIFNHAGKDYYAIPFMQGEKVSYWDEAGNSLRKNLLKAPLSYSRISSTFSNSRLHPVYKVRRPHHGVDYAAPAGTPVYAVADGVVTFRGWGGGGGNTLKIKHASNLESGYLHLRGFADGIHVGKRVSQGDLIGYVGSTGTSTGPHLDFRLWKNGTAIDPLKVPSEPAEPIADSNRVGFELVKERIIAELGSTLPDSLVITRLDSLSVPSSAWKLSLHKVETDSTEDAEAAQ